MTNKKQNQPMGAYTFTVSGTEYVGMVTQVSSSQIVFHYWVAADLDKLQKGRTEMGQNPALPDDICRRTFDAVSDGTGPGGYGAEVIAGIVRATLKEESKNRRDSGINMVTISNDDMDTINKCLQSLEDEKSIFGLALGPDAGKKYVRIQQ
jgi:hypothetical protein